MIRKSWFHISGLIAYSIENRNRHFKSYVPENETDYSGYKVFQVIPENTHHLRVLKDLESINGLDVWTNSRIIKIPAVVMVPPEFYLEFLEFLEINAMNYIPLIHDVQKTIERERYQQLTTPENSSFFGRDYSDVSLNFDKYYRVKEMEKYLQQLERKYPDLVKHLVIGQSYEGRNLNMVKISTKPVDNRRKPAILIDGGIHAREWIAPATVLYLIYELVENHKQNSDLVQDIDWYLMPCLNPDGYEYSHTAKRLWRKNRSVNKKSNCWGTDLNRNFDFHWQEGNNERLKDPCSAVYAGFYRCSEPETKALTNFGMRIRDDLRLYISLHSYGQYILYPYGYTELLPENVDELHTVAERVKESLSYKYVVGNSTRTLYPASGTSDDWFKGVAGVDLSYTIELPGGGSEGFDLPPDKIQKVGQDILKGMRVFANYVKERYKYTMNTSMPENDGGLLD